MSFSLFALRNAKSELKLATIATTQELFAKVQSVPLSEALAQFFHKFQALGMSMPTEKGRSELLVAPLLAEACLQTKHQVSLYSGFELNIDKDRRLDGVCDFLFGKSKQHYHLEALFMTIVQAKQESILNGLGQCVVQMVAIQHFNQKANTPSGLIYGCVTTGSLWRFLRLSDQQLDIDLNEYHIAQADKILGILLYCFGVHAQQ